MNYNEWIQIDGSSQIKAVMIGVLPGSSNFVDLCVEFHSGNNTYVYSDVPIDVAEGLFTADSAGEYLNQHIKSGGYTFTKEPK